MPSPFTLRYKLGLSQRDTNTAVRDAGRAMSDVLAVPRRRKKQFPNPDRGNLHGGTGTSDDAAPEAELRCYELCQLC